MRSSALADAVLALCECGGFTVDERASGWTCRANRAGETYEGQGDTPERAIRNCANRVARAPAEPTSPTFEMKILEMLDQHGYLHPDEIGQMLAETDPRGWGRTWAAIRSMERLALVSEGERKKFRATALGRAVLRGALAEAERIARRYR